MSKRQEIEALLRADEMNKTQIAAECGVSRQTVNEVAKELGMVRTRLSGQSSFIPEHVNIPIKARRRHPHVMLKALEARMAGIEIAPGKARELEGFKRELENNVWTYTDDLGWMKLPREGNHGDRPFVPVEETILHKGVK